MLKLFKNLGKEDWLLIVIAFVLIVVQVALELKMPDYMSEITVLVETEGSEMSEILENRWIYASMCIRKFACRSCDWIFNFKSFC